MRRTSLVQVCVWMMHASVTLAGVVQRVALVQDSGVYFNPKIIHFHYQKK